VTSQPRIIAVASGKGGAGKTNVTLNLAWALSRLGNRVCILDADLGLSNVDVLLGLVPQRTLDQVLFEGVPLELVVTPVATGIDLVPGSSGVARMAELTRAARTRLVREFSALSGYDYLLVDNSPGISPQVLALCLAAQELVVVVNPEVTSLTDAYALIKVLRGRGLAWPPLVLVNRAPNAQAAELAFRRIQATAQKHLGLNCSYLGHVPEDAAVPRAAALQRAVLEAFPQSPFARAVVQAAGRLARSAGESAARGKDPASFWDESVRALQNAEQAEQLQREQRMRQAARSAPPATGASSQAPASGVDAEAQGMMREMEAVRALFTRLNFKGAPEPLRRISEAGRGHAEKLMAALTRMAPGVAPIASAPPDDPASVRHPAAIPAATPAETTSVWPTPGAARAPSSDTEGAPPPTPAAESVSARKSASLSLPPTPAASVPEGGAGVRPGQAAMPEAAGPQAVIPEARPSVTADVMPEAGPQAVADDVPAPLSPNAQGAPDAQSGPVVLVRCGNQAMGQILADILRGQGVVPVLDETADGAAGWEADETGRIPSVAVLAAAKPSAAVRAWLEGLNGVPVLVLDESFGRGRAVWLSFPGVRAVLPVPFEVPAFVTSVRELVPA